MKLFILVEGRSEEAFLEQWLPKFIPGHTYKVIPHQGKGKLPRAQAAVDPKRRGLLDQLPMKLRAYGKTLDPRVARVLVLVDQDEDDCGELKTRLTSMIAQLESKPVTSVRIATKETEAFFLGDSSAIRRAYPKMSANKLKNYRPNSDPETGTWELFASVIGATSEDKVTWAETMGKSMKAERPVPTGNHSKSFQHFCAAILKLVGEGV